MATTTSPKLQTEPWRRGDSVTVTRRALDGQILVGPGAVISVEDAPIRLTSEIGQRVEIEIRNVPHRETVTVTLAKPMLCVSAASGSPKDFGVIGLAPR